MFINCSLTLFFIDSKVSLLKILALLSYFIKKKKKSAYEIWNFLKQKYEGNESVNLKDAIGKLGSII